MVRRIWRALTENHSETDPASPDPGLRGRTYAIPFEEVWRRAVELADGGMPRWRMVEADDQEGVIRAEARTRIFRFVDDVRISVGLDENALTRVDMASSSRTGKCDLGTNARRIRRFFRELDRALEKPSRTERKGE